MPEAAYDEILIGPDPRGEKFDFRLFYEFHNKFRHVSSLLTPFLEVFDSKNFLYVDGVRIVSDPNSDFAEFEKFFDLDHQLEFEMDEEKGYPVFEKAFKILPRRWKRYHKRQQEFLFEIQFLVNLTLKFHLFINSE